MGSRDTADTCLERWVQGLGLAVVVPTLLVLFGAAVFAVGDAVLAPAPAPDHPAFVDTVLGSRAVVAAIRLAIIFTGVFVVVSVVALIARGQWLTKVGPVEVSENVGTMDKESQRLESRLADAHGEIGRLRQEIAEYMDLINSKSRNTEGPK
jgi:hypothetical protein